MAPRWQPSHTRRTACGAPVRVARWSNVPYIACPHCRMVVYGTWSYIQPIAVPAARTPIPTVRRVVDGGRCASDRTFGARASVRLCGRGATGRGFAARRRSAAAGRPAAWRRAARRPTTAGGWAEVAVALALGALEGRAARIDALGVEHGAFARRVRGRQIHAVFTHARRELRERLARARTAEPRGSAGREVAATALLQPGLQLRGALALR